MPKLAKMITLSALLAIIIALLSIIGFASSRVKSGDIFWQLQSGKYILETRDSIRHDTFTLAADAPRIEHCWLHDVVFFIVHRIFGYTGISLLKGLLVGCTALIIVLAARTTGASYFSILLISIPAFLVMEWAWLDRPQLWSFLLFSLFILILEKYRKTPNRLAYLLVPFMMIWSNLHAGAMLAFPIIASYVVGEGIDTRLKRSNLSIDASKKLYWILFLLAAATVVTPYGPHIIKGLFSHIFQPTTGELGHHFLRNVDWTSWGFRDYPLFYYSMGATFIVLLTVWRRVALCHVILLAGLAFMGVKQARQIPLFFFALAVFMPMYTEIMCGKILAKFQTKYAALLRIASLSVALVLIIFISQNLYARTGFFDTGIKTWRFPADGALFIKQHALPQNIFNSYEWGGYLAWKLFPEYKVFWDARNNSREFYVEGTHITNGDSNWEQMLERRKVQTLVLMPCSLTSGNRFGIVERLMLSPSYSLVYGDEFSLIFVRNDAVSRSWLVSYRLPKTLILETILAATELLIEEYPGRYPAYFEMFRVYYAKGEPQKALYALKAYLDATPVRDPKAEKLYLELTSAVE